VRIGITESDQRSILPGSTAAGRNAIVEVAPLA